MVSGLEVSAIVVAELIMVIVKVIRGAKVRKRLEIND